MLKEFCKNHSKIENELDFKKLLALECSKNLDSIHTEWEFGELDGKGAYHNGWIRFAGIIHKRILAMHTYRGHAVTLIRGISQNEKYVFLY